MLGFSPGALFRRKSFVGQQKTKGMAVLGGEYFHLCHVYPILATPMVCMGRSLGLASGLTAKPGLAWAASVLAKLIVGLFINVIVHYFHFALKRLGVFPVWAPHASVPSDPSKEADPVSGTGSLPALRITGAPSEAPAPLTAGHDGLEKGISYLECLAATPIWESKDSLERRHHLVAFLGRSLGHS